MVDFASGVPVRRDLDVRWIHGSASAKDSTDPAIQVHEYDPHTFILRQSMAVHREAPFMFLMFGSARAVLIDTGATESAELFPLRPVVDELVARWLAANPVASYGLLVLHTHAHSDHIAGDAQFVDRPDTVVVDSGMGSIRASMLYAGKADASGHAPAEVGETDCGPGDPAHPDLGLDLGLDLDLGGRLLTCQASPGHHEAAVTFYDDHSGFLLTGDTVYPGRLYVEDWSAFRGTVDRLVSFAESRPVTHVLGCHVEMTSRPGIDYPAVASYQPDERPLQMTVAQLHDLRAAIQQIDHSDHVHDIGRTRDGIGEGIGDETGRHTFPDFVICCE